MSSNIRLKDIAHKLGVSVTTISKVLNNHPDISPARKEEVKRMIKELNYVPNSMASTLRTKHTNFVGLLVPDNTNPYYARLINGVEEKLRGEGFFTLICNTRENATLEIEFINNLRSINVAGVIITPVGGDDKSMKYLRAVGIPYVIANRYITEGKDNYVIADDYRAGFLATEHLLARHPGKKVVMINGHINSSTAKDRFRGYRDALKKLGPRSARTTVYDGYVTSDHGYEIAAEILKTHRRPISILCYSDYVAIGVLNRLEDAGVAVPAEVAVMGIDDIESSGLTNRKLSSIAIPKRRMGIKCAEILLELIAARKAEATRPNTHFVHEVSLVVRAST